LFKPDPKQVRAIVVGIDHYEYGSKWRLVGPTNDALRMVGWLMDHGVEQSQIALFLSPASWQEPEVKQWKEKHEWKAAHEATLAAIKQFVDQELHLLNGDSLFFYWGGHGLVDSDTDENYLLVADATKRNTYYVNLQSLFDTLKLKKFARFAQQLCIVDACATPYNEIRTEIALSEVNFTGGAMKHQDIEQCFFFAASPGRLADNDSDNGWGVFSRNLFQRLPPPAQPPTLDDFVTIFREVRTKSELGTQRPCMTWIKGMGDLERFGFIPSLSQASVRLLALIRELDIDLKRCKRLYLRCLPNATRPSPEDGLEQWVRHLADIPHSASDHPSPLAEFAFRLGRETGRAVLEEWAQQQCKPEQVADLRRKLLDEDTMQKMRYATLFLELTEDGRQLLWWLWAEQPHLRSVPVAENLSPQKLHANLGKILPKVLDQAYQHIAGDCELRISMILPFTQLPAGLENIELELELDGMPSNESLHQRYPLLLHWNRRAYPDSLFHTRARWEQAVGKLQERMDQGSGTTIHWLDHQLRNPHEAAKNQLIKGDGQATCVGLDGVSAQAASLLRSIQGCLQQGIPCFLWLQREPADPVQARYELKNSLGAAPAAEVPLELKRLAAAAGHSSVLTDVRIVWDLPAYLPTSNPLQPLLPGT